MVSDSKLDRSLNYIFNDHLLRLPIIAFTTLASLYVHFVGSPDIEHNNITLRIACVLLSEVVLVLGIRVSYRFLKLIRNRRIGAILFLVTLPFLGALRGFVLEHYLGAFKLVSEGDFYYRVFGSAITMGACVAGLSYAVGVYEAWIRKSAALEKSQRKLEQLLSEAALKVESDRNDDLSLIKSELFRGLRVNSARNESALIDTLHSVVVEVLKPLSEKIINGSPLPAVRESRPETTKFQFQSLMKFLTLKKSIRPVPITVILITTFTPLILRFEGLLPTLEIVGIAVVLVTPSLYLLQVIAAKPVDKFISGWKILVLALLLGLSVLPFDALMPVLVPNIREIGLPPVQVVITVIALGITYGLGSAAEEEILRIQSAQIENAHLIRWNTARFYATHWFQKRQYARKLHGPMQAEVLAHVMRIEKSMVAGQDSKQLNLNSGVSLETRLMDLLNAPRTDLNPVDVLTELAETWEGICAIDVSFDAGLTDELIQDQIACETVLEIIREATSNAIQHGKANEIRVCVSRGEDDCVALTISDNGSGIANESVQKGQGSRYLEECTIDYELESSPAGASLSAKVPLSCSSSHNLQLA